MIYLFLIPIFYVLWKLWKRHCKKARCQFISEKLQHLRPLRKLQKIFKELCERKEALEKEEQEIERQIREIEDERRRKTEEAERKKREKEREEYLASLNWKCPDCHHKTRIDCSEILQKLNCPNCGCATMTWFEGKTNESIVVRKDMTKSSKENPFIQHTDSSDQGPDRIYGNFCTDKTRKVNNAGKQDFEYFNGDYEYILMPVSITYAKQKAFKLFRLKEDSTIEQIEKRYRAFALKYHPDTSKEENAEEKFKQILTAFNELKK